MRFFKFSLRTLVLATLCVASGMAVYPRLAPWREEASLPAPVVPNANPFNVFAYSGLNDAIFLANDTRLAVIADSGLHLWNLKERTVESHWGSWRSAFWMDACTAPLAIFEKDKTYSIFNLARPDAVLFEVKADYLHPMQAAGGGVVSLLSQDAAEIWDCEAGKRLWATKGEARVTLSRDGKWAAVVENDSPVVRVCEARTGVVKHELKQDKARLYYALFTPDGNTVVGTEAESSGNNYFAWSMKDGALLSSWQLPANQIRHGTFSPDSRCVAVVDSVGKTTVWEIATGREVVTITASNSGSNCETLTYFPDGRRLLIGYAAGGTAIFDTATGARLWAVSGDPDEWESVFLAARGDRMAIVNRDGEVRILKYDHREEWWGLATLPEFWLAVGVALGLMVSVVRDWREAGRRSEILSPTP